MMIEAEDVNGQRFPMVLETKRMAPGATNDWFLEVYGLECSAKFNSNEPDVFCYTNSWGKEQAWCKINVTPLNCISGLQKRDSFGPPPLR
jgi:hypothetical protein